MAHFSLYFDSSFREIIALRFYQCGAAEHYPFLITHMYFFPVK